MAIQQRQAAFKRRAMTKRRKKTQPKLPSGVHITINNNVGAGDRPGRSVRPSPG